MGDIACGFWLMRASRSYEGREVELALAPAGRGSHGSDDARAGAGGRRARSPCAIGRGPTRVGNSDDVLGASSDQKPPDAALRDRGAVGLRADGRSRADGAGAGAEPPSSRATRGRAPCVAPVAPGSWRERAEESDAAALDPGAVRLARAASDLRQDEIWRTLRGRSSRARRLRSRGELSRECNDPQGVRSELAGGPALSHRRPVPLAVNGAARSSA